MSDESPPFLGTLPGILTGLAALVTAAAGTWGIVLKSRDTPAPNPPPAQARAEEPRAQPARAGMPCPQRAGDQGGSGRYSQKAVIKDTDGFVNVRNGPSTACPVVTKVDHHEKLHTRPPSGNWRPVRTSDGTEGWVYHDRLRVVDG